MFLLYRYNYLATAYSKSLSVVYPTTNLLLEGLIEL